MSQVLRHIATRRLVQSPTMPPPKKSASPVKRIAAVVVTGLAFYVALPAFVKVLSAWPKLFHLSFAWLALMLAAEVASFVCAMTLLRLLLRTKHWFTVVAALLVGNAVTNVLPAGDVAGAGVQYQMLAIGGIDADAAAGGLAAASIIGLAGLFLLPVCVLPAILGGLPVSPGLEHAAYLGIAGFVLIVAFGTVLLTTNGLLTWLARMTQRALNATAQAQDQDRDLPDRLITERNLVRTNLGRRWREAVLLIGGRIGFDYFALAVRAARDRAPARTPRSCCWPTPRPRSSPSCRSRPADSASSRRVSVACSCSRASPARAPSSRPSPIDS